MPEVLGDILKPWALGFPDKPALVEAGGVWTYGELDAHIATATNWLRQSGIRPGDRVMVVCENCRAFVAILFALSAIDAGLF
jgi:long-chain acyl-CoA synthetase